MQTSTIRTIELPAGERIPVLGQGTGGLAEDPDRRRDEIAALRTGIDLGMTLIDTAEVYADGGAERLVGEAIADRRDQVFLVDKVAPDNASELGMVSACEHSLRRLGTDHIDLYLLHWRGAVPLEETVEAFAELVRQGKIRYWGVSNFDVPDLAELTSMTDGREVQTDQVLYNLSHRGIEWDLLPRSRELGLPVMAYAPFEHGRMLGHPALRRVAERHGASPAQVALAWVLRHDTVTAVARSADPQHVRANRAAVDLRLTPEDLAELDREFPPPHGPTPLEEL
ncbi:MAG: aldo/keto reductase [Dactylosporangium sp.]|nr:aldo/keto reductase [Dactylosporangium sp.]